MRLRRRSRYVFAAFRYRHTYRRTLEHLVTREELPILLNRRGLVGEGVEIGVKKAAFSESLLRSWRGDRLISIDPWREADPDEYLDDANVAQRKQDKFFQHAQDRLARFGDRSEIWRLTSLEGAERISPHSLDFVFIDARHDHDSVVEDLEAWFDKVRPGGIISGHDYVDGDLENGVFGVKSAVDEFFAARGIPVHNTERPDPLFPSWFAEIPTADNDASGTAQPSPAG